MKYLSYFNIFQKLSFFLSVTLIITPLFFIQAKPTQAQTPIKPEDDTNTNATPHRTSFLSRLSNKIYCTLTGLFINTCELQGSTVVTTILSPTSSQSPAQNTTNITSAPIIEYITQPVQNFTTITGITNEYLEQRLLQLKQELALTTVPIQHITKTSSSGISSKQIDSIYDSMRENNNELEDQIEALTIPDLANGPAGYVLQSNGATFNWVATSTLGISGGGGAIDLNALTEIEVGDNNTTFGEFSLALGQNNIASSSTYGAYGTNHGAVALGFGNTSSASGYYGAASSAMGINNTASGYYSSVFGLNKIASAEKSSASGYNNTASGLGASAFGFFNTASRHSSSAFGYFNTASATSSSALGRSNIASGARSSASGYGNNASGDHSSALGSINTATGNFSVAVGGNNSAISTLSGYYGALYGAVALGFDNNSTASGYYGAGSSAMGISNTASGEHSSAFGSQNTASENYSSASGNKNTASGIKSSASGYYNFASGVHSSAFGNSNNSSALGATTFGQGNIASGIKSSASGYNNSSLGQKSTASGAYNTASGINSSAFGLQNTASGYSSSVFGSAITNNIDSSLMIGPSDTAKITITLIGAIGIRGTTTPAAAGAAILDSSGAKLTTGGTWTNASSRDLKENFSDIDKEELLNKISELDLQSWNYKAEDASIKHIGPMAQQFYELFGLGGSSTSISTIDPAGLALVGIQALQEKFDWIGKYVTKTTDGIIGRFKELTTDKFNLNGDFCVDDICLTKDEFKAMIKKNGAEQVTSSTQDESDDNDDTDNTDKTATSTDPSGEAIDDEDIESENSIPDPVVEEETIEPMIGPTPEVVELDSEPEPVEIEATPAPESISESQTETVSTE